MTPDTPSPEELKYAYEYIEDADGTHPLVREVKVIARHSRALAEQLEEYRKCFEAIRDTSATLPLPDLRRQLMLIQSAAIRALSDPPSATHGAALLDRAEAFQRFYDLYKSEDCTWRSLEDASIELDAALRALDAKEGA